MKLTVFLLAACVAAICAWHTVQAVDEHDALRRSAIMYTGRQYSDVAESLRNCILSVWDDPTALLDVVEVGPNGTVITYNLLRQYRSVLIYDYVDAIGNTKESGDIIMDYTKQGGGLVIGLWLNADNPLGGGFLLEGNYPIDQTEFVALYEKASRLSTYENCDLSHPVSSGFYGFVTQGTYASKAKLNNHTRVVCNYTDGTPMIVEMEKPGQGKIVHANWPTVESFNLVVGSHCTLLANSLDRVARCECPHGTCGAHGGCIECDAGWWAKKCDTPCECNPNRGVCDRWTGKCIPGSCIEGFTGPLCDVPVHDFLTCDAETEKAFTDAMRTFYSNMNGPHWKNNRGWSDTSSTNPCLDNWYGVECDGKCMVRSLILSNNNLTRSEGQSQADFKSLAMMYPMRVLDLSDNDIGGTMQPEIAYLTRLQSLILRNTNMNGTIPLSISHMRQLQYVDLGHNRFSGGMPSFKGSKDALMYLYLNHNQLTGTWGTQLLGNNMLRSIWLQFNNMNGHVPRYIKDMVLLNELRLTNSGLVFHLPRWVIERLSKLLVLETGHTNSRRRLLTTPFGPSTTDSNLGPFWPAPRTPGSVPLTSSEVAFVDPSVAAGLKVGDMYCSGPSNKCAPVLALGDSNDATMCDHIDMDFTPSPDQCTPRKRTTNASFALAPSGLCGAVAHALGCRLRVLTQHWLINPPRTHAHRRAC